MNLYKGFKQKKLMLSIKNLHASIGGKEILKNQSRSKAGEIHAIMGPNGAGKNTLQSSSQEMKPMK
jgi:Fe-S cluster assembly ATP-binding protein